MENDYLKKLNEIWNGFKIGDVPRIADPVPDNFFHDPLPQPEYGKRYYLGSPTIFSDFPEEYKISLSHSDYMELFMILTDLDKEDLLAVINDQAIEQFAEYRRNVKEIGGVFESEVHSGK